MTGERLPFCFQGKALCRREDREVTGVGPNQPIDEAHAPILSGKTDFLFLNRETMRN